MEVLSYLCQQYLLFSIHSDIVDEGFTPKTLWCSLVGEGLLVTASKNGLEYYFQVAPTDDRLEPENTCIQLSDDTSREDVFERFNRLFPHNLQLELEKELPQVMQALGRTGNKFIFDGTFFWVHMERRFLYEVIKAWNVRDVNHEGLRKRNFEQVYAWE